MVVVAELFALLFIRAFVPGPDARVSRYAACTDGVGCPGVMQRSFGV